jgi:hypothetical protein
MNFYKPMFFVRYLPTVLFFVSGLAIAQDLYVYPAEGQSDEQLGSDRYECHSWAAQESDFDPTDFGEEPPSTVRVPTIANQSEGATRTGAIVGATAGAVIGSQEADAGKGAVLGAVIGSMIGGVVEEQGRQDADQQAAAEVARQSEEINRTKAERALRQSNYRRALTACLEGRGYSVK